MPTVVVERAFAQPVTFAEIQAVESRGASCLDAHGVRFLKSYFSRDRRRMICLYEAKDAESVRLAERKARVPFDEAWTAEVIRHEGAEPEDDAVVVERVLPRPFDEAGIRKAVADGAWCRQQYATRIVWTYLSPDGLRCVCVFGAPDAESVRQSQRQSGMPYETAWPASVHRPSREP
jgi:hypothetical protein